MKIYKFQNGTKDFDVGVLYSTHGEEMRLQSNDSPSSEVGLHAASVVFLALSYFGLNGLRAHLKEIVFSEGQHGAQTGIVLQVLDIFGTYAKLVLPKVGRADVENVKTHEVDPTHPRNMLNVAVNCLEGAIMEYVRGRRQQAVFNFQAEQEREAGDDGDDYGDEESNEEEALAGRNMLRFAGANA